jgi:predicted 3-demethylubiquinone-9 3-methyltransferase (glyoxalase superfamily)
MLQKITPFLWFDHQALEAAEFYASIFKNSHIDDIGYYAEGNHQPAGKVMTVSFTLDGVHFTALNGGPEFHFTPAISFFVTCDSQEEIDYFWEKLGKNGEYVQCGWLTDRYGLSWQIVPSILPKLLGNPDPEKAKRATQAMLQMTKLIIKDLEDA